MNQPILRLDGTGAWLAGMDLGFRLMGWDGMRHGGMGRVLLNATCFVGWGVLLHGNGTCVVEWGVGREMFVFHWTGRFFMGWG